MIQAQTISWTAADTAAKLQTYRRILLVSIVLNLIVAFIIIFWPHFFTSTLHQPDAFPSTWPRHWGFQLVAINLLYVPGYKRPLDQRWPNWLGILIRLTFALFFFSQGDGFVWMGLYDGGFGLLLLVTYARLFRADVMSKP